MINGKTMNSKNILTVIILGLTMLVGLFIMREMKK